MPTCPHCGDTNPGGDPYDRSCRRCGYDPDDPDQAADLDEAGDHRMRSDPLRRRYHDDRDTR
mgnify:CR=1 FL=1